jgi:hypothetical protein
MTSFTALFEEYGMDDAEIGVGEAAMQRIRTSNTTQQIYNT